MSEVVTFTKSYRFSAGHRLYVKGLSDEENFRIFDSCSNPAGHGHDYYLEVKVADSIDPVTGRIISRDELDRAVTPVIEELDYKRLDIEVPYFRDRQPTGEHITEYIWNRLEPRIPCKLVHLSLSETGSSYFEYFHEEECPYER